MLDHHEIQESRLDGLWAWSSMAYSLTFSPWTLFEVVQHLFWYIKMRILQPSEILVARGQVVVHSQQILCADISGETLAELWEYEEKNSLFPKMHSCARARMESSLAELSSSMFFLWPLERWIVVAFWINYDWCKKYFEVKARRIAINMGWMIMCSLTLFLCHSPPPPQMCWFYFILPRLKKGEKMSHTFFRSVNWNSIFNSI